MAIKRRDFVSGSLAAAAAETVAGGLPTADAKATSQAKPGATAQAPRRSILNFHENMEYRRLGKTGLMVSAVCMGGHWKRVGTMLPAGSKLPSNWMTQADVQDSPFLRNRAEVVSRAIDMGINYIDACTREEVLTYSRVLKGRRDKVYLGYSWYQNEPRNKEYRTVAALMQSIDNGLKSAGLEYVDLWRITLPEEKLPDLAELQRIEDATFGALEKARKQGKARFTGISTHNRPWLKSIIEQYPDVLQVACTPYTASSKELPGDSVFAAIRKHDVGVFGIKPFASNALFQGDSSANSPHREADDRRARLAIRYILGNPAITAPIAGLATPQQVDNIVRAVGERRKLDPKEAAELERATGDMWANLHPTYEWLKNWEYV